MAFMGLSGAIVGEVGKTVGSWVKNPFNRIFFYWYFFPVLIFILFHQFVIRPTAFDEYPPNPIDYANQAVATLTPAAEGSLDSPFADAPPIGAEATPAPTAEPPPQAEFVLPTDTGNTDGYLVGLIFSFLGVDLFNYLLIPFVAGVGLNAIAFQITSFYTGRVWPLSWLLAPLKLRNRAKSQELYGNLPDLRNEYLRLYRVIQKAAKTEAAPPGADALAPKPGDAQKQLRAMKAQITDKHDEIEKKARVQTLPMTADWVTATALGNTLAVAEEYSFNTYGMDADLFWPRLRAELTAEDLQPIDSAKSVVDGMLNFSLLAYLAAIESLIVIFFIPAELRGDWWRVPLLLGCGILSASIGYGAYRGAVGAADNMGMIMRTYFDYHRAKVFTKFNLQQPDKIEDEKVIWYKLTAFLRRGESFYFPEEAEID